MPYLVMHTKGPLGTPVTSRSVVGGATWGLRNGFDVGGNPHYLGRFRVLVVELARLHAIACKVYGLGPEAVLQGTRFRRCLLLFI